MNKKITIIYNNTPIVFQELVNTSDIHYNNKIIQSDFIGTKILKCNRNIMDDNIYIDVIILSCKDLTMNDDLKVISEWDYTHVGPKPTSPPPITFDGQLHNNGFDISSKIGIDMAGDDSGTDVGTYIAVYTPQESYSWNDDTNTPVILVLTINQKSIENAIVTLDNIITYSGEEQTQNIKSIIVDGLNINTYTIKNNTGIDAGTYILTCTGENNFTSEVNKEWIINKLKLNIPYLSDNSKIYTGNPQSPTINNFNTTWEIQSGNITATEVGEYSINWNLKDTSNLIWANDTYTEKFATWTINKATGSCDGGINVNPTYNANSQQIISNCTGTGQIVYSLDQSNWFTSPIEQIDAGSYTVYYKALESKNYTESEVKSVICTISPAVIDFVELDKNSTQFNGDTQTVSVIKAKSGKLEIPEDSYIMRGNTSAYSIGTYTIKIIAKNNFTGEIDKDWEIIPAVINTFTLNTTSINFTNSNQSVSVSQCLANGLIATYTTSGVWSATEAGTYTATVTGTGNFSGSLSQTWTINHIVAWAHYKNFSYGTTTKIAYPQYGSGIGGSSNFQILYSGNYRIQVTAGSGNKLLIINGTTHINTTNASYQWEGWLNAGDTVLVEAVNEGYQLCATIIMSSYANSYYVSWTWEGSARYSYPQGGRYINNISNNTWQITQSGNYSISIAGTYGTVGSKLLVNGVDQGVSIYRDSGIVYKTLSLTAGDSVQICTTGATEGFDTYVWRTS